MSDGFHIIERGRDVAAGFSWGEIDVLTVDLSPAIVPLAVADDIFDDEGVGVIRVGFGAQVADFFAEVVAAKVYLRVVGGFVG